MKTVSSIIISLFLTTAAFAQTTVNVSSEQDSPVAAVKSSLNGSMFEIVGRADRDMIILHLNKETGEASFLVMTNISRLSAKRVRKMLLKQEK